MSLAQRGADVSHFIRESSLSLLALIEGVQPQLSEISAWFREISSAWTSWLIVQDEFNFWLSIAVFGLSTLGGALAVSKVIRKIISVILAVCQKVMRMFGLIRKHDQGSQTDEWEPPSLPTEIFYKDKKDVYHLRGCHYLSFSDHGTFSKRACSTCYKLWNKGVLPLPL